MICRAQDELEEEVPDSRNRRTGEVVGVAVVSVERVDHVAGATVDEDVVAHVCQMVGQTAWGARRMVS